MAEPLQEIESEKNLISYILTRGVSGQEDLRLKPEDFYLDLHKRTFQAVQDLIQIGTPIDLLTATNHMREVQLFKDEGKELQYLANLLRETVPAQPLDYYVFRVKKVSDRRRYIHSLEEAIRKVSSEPGENDSVFSFVEQSLMEISREERSKGLIRIKQDAKELIDYISNVVKQSSLGSGGISGLKTHFHAFDQYTTGLKSHELVIIAGRPGYGKTTLALNIASHVAMRDLKTVAIFSLEMSRLEIELKLLSSESRIDSYSIKSGSLTQANLVGIKDAIAKITAAPIYIDDSGYLSIQEFAARVRQLKTQEDLSLIVVDYLQLLSDPTAFKSGGRQQEVANVSRGLKQVAREMNCPVIALSQMSRNIESRSGDQRPQLSDLRESGAIEQDADIVCFIYREEMVKTKEEIAPEKKGVAEIIIAKNRSGSTGEFSLLFNPKIGKFDNMQKME